MTDYTEDFDENLNKKDSLIVKPLGGQDTSENLLAIIAKGGSYNFTGSDATFDRIFSGLPISTTVPTRAGKTGEIILYKDTSNSDYRIYCYIDAAWKKIGDIDFLLTSDFTFTYFEAFATNYQAASNDWEDWNISALVGANTRFAEIMMVNTTATSRTMGVRKDGSALLRTVGIIGNARIIFTVEVSATGVIEIKTDDFNNSAFQVIGYWV